MDEDNRAAQAARTPHKRGGGRRGPHYKVLFVPPELHAEIKRLAKEQHRSIIGQVMHMMQDAVERERAQTRRAQDQARGAA